MLRYLVAGAVVAAALSAARPANADPLQVASDPPSTQIASSPSTSGRRWYGWQILLVYAASDTLIAAGALASLESKKAGITLGVLGGAGHLLGGPLVHEGHGRRIGYLVGGMNALALGAGASLAVATTKGCEPARKPACYERSEGAMAIGAGLGALAAGAVEVGAIAYEDRKRSASRIHLVPLVSRETVGLSLGGAF